jgi:hypothetical protein
MTPKKDGIFKTPVDDDAMLQSTPNLNSNQPEA